MPFSLASRFRRRAFLAHRAVWARVFCLLLLASAVFSAEGASAQAPDESWRYSEEERPGETPGLFAQVWSSNYLTRTRSLVLLKCDLEPETGGAVHLVFIPSKRVRADPEAASGLARLYWRVDDGLGVPLEARVSIVNEGTRLQYVASGAPVEEMMRGIMRGRLQLYFVDSTVPEGGVLDVFKLEGARSALGRVLRGCDEFEPRPRVVLPGLSEEDALEAFELEP